MVGKGPGWGQVRGGADLVFRDINLHLARHVLFVKQLAGVVCVCGGGGTMVVKSACHALLPTGESPSAAALSMTAVGTKAPTTAAAEAAADALPYLAA
jgi:hypothetical protein